MSYGLPSGVGRHHFFCSDVLQHDVVEHRLGEKLLQLCVLGLERLQPAGVRHLKTAVLRLPLVEGRAADPVLPAYLCRRCTCFLLPQDADDLLFTEPRWPHRPSPFRSTDSTQIWRTSRGSGQMKKGLRPEGLLLRYSRTE